MIMEWAQHYIFWLVAAVLAGALEIMLPGFYFLGLAIGLAVAGLLAAIFPVGPALLLLIAALVAIGAILWLRGRIGAEQMPDDPNEKPYRAGPVDKS